jgi:hypothetical protein
MKHLKTVLAGAAAAAFFVTPAVAQQQEGLITVNISNVANDIARNLSVEVSQIPVTVQAPIDVAANVCGVGANVLGSQRDSGQGSCTAQSASAALNEIVQREVGDKNKGDAKK